VSDLPPAWVAAPIGTLCSLNNGRAFKPTEWSTNGLPIVRIQNLNDPKAKFNHYSGDYGDQYHLKGGELLFAWSGTPGTSFGAHVWQGGEALLNQHIFRVDLDERAIERRFFRYAINQKLDELIGKAHGGVGLRHVTKGKFEQTEIALPPRAEQTRIADKLESLLAKVSGCQEQLNRVPQILKKFREAVLDAAVSGRLTEEWRSEVGVKRKDWRTKTLVELCEPTRVITYGVIKLGDETPDGAPCLRTSNVRWLRIDEGGIKRIRRSLSAEYSRTILTGSEVLVNVRGTLGGVSDVPQHMIGWNVSREIAVVPVSADQAIPRFLALEIATNSGQRWLRGVQKGVAYTGINIEDLRAFPVELPSLNEQREIARRVGELFAFADSLKRRYEAAAARFEKLTPSILAKAFRGELVPQDPNDEPANVLLDQTRSERQSKTQRKERHSNAGVRR
jgi:type I restriction enzyme S subunit